jgi:HK97 family phage major capsid protein
MKVVGDIGANSNISVSGTPAFMPGPGLWEPGRKPYEVRHVRELMRVVPQPAGMDTYVIRDQGGEGGPTSVAAGAAKPQSDRDWVKTIVPITKIAHYYKVPEEYLADISWMQDEITGVGVEELLVKEDQLILTNNAGGEFLGLNQTLNSTAYSTPGSLSGIFTGSIEANNYDVLVAAWTQLRVLKSFATGVLLHPQDYAAMILTKDTTGNYPFGAPNQSIPNLFGAPIVAHTAVTSDKFFLGDFSKVKVGVRAGLTVRFYDQNEDDAITNMVTVVIEERITMAADRADRVIYGDFSDAQTALES